LGTHRRGTVPRAIVAKSCGASRDREVTLDGAPARTSATRVGPRVAVTDQGDGFRVALEDDPEISEVFQNASPVAAIRCGPWLIPS